MGPSVKTNAISNIYSTFSKVIQRQRAEIEFEVNEDDIEPQWYKDGIEINFQYEERYSYVVERRVHRMSIFETTYSDAGEYTFVAGRNRSSVVLYVNGMCPHKQCFDCIYYPVFF